MDFKYKKVDPGFFYKQFSDVAKDMWEQFERIKRDSITNSTDEGEYLERLLVSFLNTYLPKKLSVGRGYIMNQEGKTSFQQDIVIYNADNYFLLRNTDGFQVFPIEAVYATIEVKSTVTRKTLEEVNVNCQSIKYLSGARLYVDSKSGEISDVEQYGSVVFTSLFAFQSDSTLKTCAENFETYSTAIDYLCILDRGITCYIDHEEKDDSGVLMLQSTTSPNREKDGIMLFEPKLAGPSAMVLAMWLEHVISHVEKHGESRGSFSMYNYLQVPPSAYTGNWKMKNLSSSGEQQWQNEAKGKA